MKNWWRTKALAASSMLLFATVEGATTATPVAADPLACGQVITQSTTLSSDVGPCAAGGLIIGADGITLHLAGHRVFGTTGEGDNVGVLLQDRTGVTITGGEITDFGAGVAIVGGSGHTVRQVSLHDNVGLLDGSGNYGDGIAILDSPGNLVQQNVVEHNGPFDGIGVFGAPSTDNVIDDNVVIRNDIARFEQAIGSVINLDDGINLGAGLSGGSRTTVRNNTIRANGFNGINACSNRGAPCITTDNVITGNLVEANGFGDPSRPDDPQILAGDGIHIVSVRPPGRDPSDFFPVTNNLVSGNRVIANAGDGIVVGSSSNQILNNVALRNGSAIRHFYFDAEDISPNHDCDSNVWRDNRFGTATPRCVRARS